MRENAKWIFYILAIAFIGWLVFDVGMGITGRGQAGSDVVLKVNGREVHLPEYQAALQAAYEQARHQTGGTLTREDEQQIQNQVVDQLTQELLLEQQYRTLGITVSDQEVIQVAQTSPPPEVLQAPDFQTNGQFDITKWQRYLSSGTDPQFLQALEARYRQQLPQLKLAQYLTADVYLSDAKLWRVYRDQRESVTVAAAAIRPEQIPDSEAPVSEAELRQYYESHKAEFKRPAVAFLSFVGQPRLPDAADTAVALARARRVHDELVRGAKFEEVAKRESSDTTSGKNGGDIGWIKRSETGFDPAFLAAVRRLPPGQLSQPVLSDFGYHIIRVDAAHGDSVHVRHILIPIDLQGKHLDYVDARADSLDKLAGERPDGGALDSAARRLNLPLSHAPRLVQGERMTLGPYGIPDVSVWAFEARVGETSPVIEARPAFYVFRLDSLTPAGTPPLEQIRADVLDAARLARKRQVAEQRARQLAQQLTLQKLRPFTRLTPPPLLQDNPLAVGAAFGLALGTRSGPIKGTNGFVVLSPLSRTKVDSAAWVKQKEMQRESLLQPARQARIQAFIAALRARAKVVDRRRQVFTPQASSTT